MDCKNKSRDILMDVTKKEVQLKSAVMLPPATIKSVNTKSNMNTPQRMFAKDYGYKNKFSSNTLCVVYRPRGKLNTSQRNNTEDVNKLDQPSGQNRLGGTRTPSSTPFYLSCNLNPALSPAQPLSFLDRRADMKRRDALRLPRFSCDVSALSVMNLTLADPLKTTSYAFLPSWPSYADTDKLYSRQEQIGAVTQLHTQQMNENGCRHLPDYVICRLCKKRTHGHCPLKTMPKMPSHTCSEFILCNLYKVSYETTECPPNSPVVPEDD